MTVAMFHFHFRHFTSLTMQKMKIQEQDVLLKQEEVMIIQRAVTDNHFLPDCRYLRTNVGVGQTLGNLNLNSKLTDLNYCIT